MMYGTCNRGEALTTEASGDRPMCLPTKLMSAILLNFCIARGGPTEQLRKPVANLSPCLAWMPIELSPNHIHSNVCDLTKVTRPEALGPPATC